MAVFSKEDQELVKRLNSILGTSHRSTPYDLKKPADLKEALVNKTGEMLDLWEYYSNIDGLYEEWDEFLEAYNTPIYSLITIDEDSSDLDSPYTDIHRLLGELLGSFEDLNRTVEVECRDLWMFALKGSDFCDYIGLGGVKFEFSQADWHTLIGNIEFPLEGYNGVAEDSMNLFTDIVVKSIKARGK